MGLKLINGYWTDEDNNRWDAKKYSMEEAVWAKESNENCIRCLNCAKCLNCEECKECFRCEDCKGCLNCNFCNGCEYCTFSHNNRSCRSCTDCEDCVICDNCRRCNDCRRCVACSYCRGCRKCVNCFNCRTSMDIKECRNCEYCNRIEGYQDNPEIYTTARIGRRAQQTMFYYGKTMEGMSIRVVCGCFNGSLDEFEESVENTHGDNEYGKQYREEIKKVRILWDLN